MIVKKLSLIANQLQSLGLYLAADKVDLVLKVYAENYGTVSKVELSKEDAQKILKHHAIEYVSEIGGGTQGKVYHGRLGHHDVAVKINLPEGYYEGMKDSEKERRVGYEGKVWNSIKNLNQSGQLSSIPSPSGSFINGSAHLPYIFGNLVVSAENSPIGQPYGILIMELLKPLNISREEIHRLFKAPKLQSLDENLVRTATEQASKVFPLSIAGKFTMNIDIEKAVQTFIKMSKIQQAFTMHEKEKNDFPNTERYIRRLLPMLRQALKTFDVFKAIEHPYNTERSLEEVFKDLQDEGDEFSPKIIENINHEIDDFIINFVIYISSSIFPRDYFHLDRPEHQDLKNLQLQDVLSTLKHLNGLGINWRDVRPENIMLRPSTGEFVIVDVGLYELKE